MSDKPSCGVGRNGPLKPGEHLGLSSCNTCPAGRPLAGHHRESHGACRRASFSNRRRACSMDLTSFGRSKLGRPLRSFNPRRCVAPRKKRLTVHREIGEMPRAARSRLMRALAWTAGLRARTSWSSRASSRVVKWVGIVEARLQQLDQQRDTRTVLSHTPMDTHGAHKQGTNHATCLRTCQALISDRYHFLVP